MVQNEESIMAPKNSRKLNVYKGFPLCTFNFPGILPLLDRRPPVRKEFVSEHIVLTRP